MASSSIARTWSSRGNKPNPEYILREIPDLRHSLRRMLELRCTGYGCEPPARNPPRPREKRDPERFQRPDAQPSGDYLDTGKANVRPDKLLLDGAHRPPDWILFSLVHWTLNWLFPQLMKRPINTAIIVLYIGTNYYLDLVNCSREYTFAVLAPPPHASRL